MGYLIDTDAIIDYLKNQETSISSFKKFINQPIRISVISFIEIEYGSMKSFQPEKRKREFKDFIDSFSVVMIPIESSVAAEFIKIKIDLEKKRVPLADFDLLIAATALVNNLILATRNKKHFSRIKNLKL